ncbi:MULTISPECIES: hypothetical protein [Cupriavidus]|nr:hypothetical protein [Cupriavidus taiwanensis]
MLHIGKLVQVKEFGLERATGVLVEGGLEGDVYGLERDGKNGNRTKKS